MSWRGSQAYGFGAKGKGKGKGRFLGTPDARVPVPDQAKGVIIGRGGETIKSLQAVPGIQNVQLQDSDLLIFGTPAAVREVRVSLRRTVPWRDTVPPA